MFALLVSGETMPYTERELKMGRPNAEKRERREVVDPPCSEFNPQTDLNDTYTQPVKMLSPVAEEFGGRADQTPPFGCPNPNPLRLGITEKERTRPVRNNDPEGYRR
jgi:hypothetical protein